MQIMIFVFMLIEIAFGLLVFKSGLEMIKIKSLQKELEQYRKTDKDFTLAKDWIFGWRFAFGRNWSKSMVSLFGDEVLTRFYHIAGYFFLVFSILFFTAPITQLQLLFL